jgi:predicted nucleic acid-binding protein
LTLYLDTSVLVCALTGETETVRIQSWLSEQTAGEMAVSDWTIAEFSSALSIKLRTGALSLEERATAMAALTRLLDESLDLWPIERRQFRAAAQIADQHLLAMRAGDALHIAVCAERGATLCTLDRRLSEACLSLGVISLLL